MQATLWIAAPVGTRHMPTTEQRAHGADAVKLAQTA
jgi:hypothetical protein